MKKFAIQFVLLIIAIFLSILFYTGRIHSIPFLLEPAPGAEVLINDIRIKVEIADTAARRKKGLGGRERLATDGGMLFVFEREDKYPFWMKGLKFPLDFIWIKGDKVSDILQNAPNPTEGQKDEDLPIYQPTLPVDKVLEVNAGVVEKLKIKVGDTVSIKY